MMFWILILIYIQESNSLPPAPPIIVISPPPKVEVDVSYTFVINCTAMGIPTPEVIWRLNWGHVPDKCRQTSTPTLVGNRALGVLECPDAQVYDQGAYSCEAINSKGSCFAGSPGCGQPGQVCTVSTGRPISRRTWVGLTLILAVPPSAWFCLG